MVLSCLRRLLCTWQSTHAQACAVPCFHEVPTHGHFECLLLTMLNLLNYLQCERIQGLKHGKQETMATHSCAAADEQDPTHAAQ